MSLPNAFYFFRKGWFRSHPREWPFILVREITRQILLFLRLHTFIATRIYLNSFFTACTNCNLASFLHSFNATSIFDHLAYNFYNSTPVRTLFPLVRNQCFRFKFSRILSFFFIGYLSSQCTHRRSIAASNYLTRRNLIPLFNVPSFFTSKRSIKIEAEGRRVQ